MYEDKLKMAEAAFLAMYPLGFDTPELAERTRHHDMTKRVAFARESFSPAALDDTETAAENFVKLVARSSMVSMYGVDVRKTAPAQRRAWHDAW